MLTIGNIQETGIEGLVIPIPLLGDLITPPTGVKTSPPVNDAKDGNIVGHHTCGRLVEGDRDKV